MASVLRLVRVFAIVAATLVSVFAASGVLYLVNAGGATFGPRIGDALPLDELSNHSAVPLALFIAVWTVAALLLGLLARLVRLERVTAALLLALCVGGWSYLQTAASILVVRQIAAEDAFRDAAAVHAVFLPAVLVGLAGAWFGSSRSVGSRAPTVLASFVAAAGLLAVVDAVLPEYGWTLIGSLAPGAPAVTRSLEGPLGLGLLAVSPGLARGRRRAWQVAMGLLVVSTVLHALHSDYAAVPVGMLSLALVARRHAFPAPGDPEAKPRILARLALLAGVTYGYGAVALWANRMAADQPFGPWFALRETSRALLGLGLGASPHLSGSFARWFALSVPVLGVASAAWLLHAWLAPWRYRLRQEAVGSEVPRSVVHAWGVDTLAPFALRADKSYFFSLDEQAFLAYRVVAGVAIVAGDPIGPPEEFPELLDDFLGFARERDWRVAVLGASDRWLQLYRGHGLRALYHGDEAVIDVEGFSLDGRAIRKVRQSVHRLTRAGYRAAVLRCSELSPELRAELDEIARRWRGNEPEHGFVMALDALFRLEGGDAVFVLGVGPDGRVRGFLHFAVVPAIDALSLSSMPRDRETPNGFTEWLVCEAVAWCREHGFRHVSLNFSPFAALLAPEAKLSVVQKVERRALLALKGHFQLDNLLLFNRKFFPSWQPRFVVYERLHDLPRVAIAALAAEAYIPFPKGSGR